MPMFDQIISEVGGQKQRIGCCREAFFLINLGTIQCTRCDRKADGKLIKNQILVVYPPEDPGCK
jgi:hypothetical protein